MSADGTTNQSNKSPASSVSSLRDEDKAPPCFVSVEMPTFAVIEVVHDPPSFALSAALKEATQLHPPVSPGMATRIFNRTWPNDDHPDNPLSPEAAEDFLRNNEDLETMVRATAYGLVSTIHRCAAQYAHNIRLAEQHTREQRALVAQREEEIARLRARPGAGQAPSGFQANEGCVTCIIPAAGGALWSHASYDRGGTGRSKWW